MDKDKLHRSLAHIAAGADKMAQAANIITHGLKNGDSPARIARHLADYGLLAPDLPGEDIVSANGTPVWRPDKGLMVTAFQDGEVRMGIPPTYPDTEFREAIYTQQSATKQALALLAAAQHAGDHDG